MLEAERIALSAEVHHASLNIIERELNILLTFMTNVGTMSALLGGFAFSFISGVGEDIHIVIEAIYLGMSVLCFGGFMYVVLVSTLCTYIAPRKAFKDKEKAAMRQAITEMEEDCKFINRIFSLSVLTFMVLLVLQVHMVLHSGDWPVFVVATVLVVAVTAATFYSIQSMHRRYAVSEAQKKGVMEGSKFLSMTEQVVSATAPTTGPA